MVYYFRLCITPRIYAPETDKEETSVHVSIHFVPSKA